MIEVSDGITTQASRDPNGKAGGTVGKAALLPLLQGVPSSDPASERTSKDSPVRSGRHVLPRSILGVVGFEERIPQGTPGKVVSPCRRREIWDL